MNLFMIYFHKMLHYLTKTKNDINLTYLVHDENLEILKELHRDRYINNGLKENGLPNRDLRFIFNKACGEGAFNVMKWILSISKEYIYSGNSCGFRWTCENGHLQIAKYIYELDPTFDINCGDEYAFRNACKNGHLDVVVWLIDISKGKINYTSTNHQAFRWACEHGHIEIAKIILQVEPNTEINSLSDYAFRYGCKNNHVIICEWLLKICPDIDINIMDDWSFREACQEGSIDSAKWIVSIDKSILEYANILNIFKSSSLKNNLRVLKWLYSIFPTYNFNFEVAFRKACKYNYLQMSKWLSKFVNVRHLNDSAFRQAVKNNSLRTSLYLTSIINEYQIKTKDGQIIDYFIE